MKKIGLGISILLFSIILAMCSTGIKEVALGIGVIGIVFSVMGYIDKNNW